MQSPETVNVLDIVAAVMAAGAFMLGYHRGLLAQLVSFAGLFVAFAVSFLFYDDLSPFIARLFPLETMQIDDRYSHWIQTFYLDVYFYNAIAFTSLFFLTKLALSVVGRILNWFAQAPGIRTVNKWSGALLALAEAAILLVVAVHLMSVIPSEPLQRTVKTSVVAEWIIAHTPDAAQKLHEMWSGPKNGDGSGEI
jgi:uncharacterized membrane protein required for colicin V production